jgi:predicted MFS family arabinose efflux permease
VSTHVRAGEGAGGWRAVGCYALVAAASQLLWLTYAPLTTASAHYYHVSESAIGWLAEIFPLLYVVLAIPAGRLLDRSFHNSLALGAVLTAAGGVVRLVAADYRLALFGQILVAVAQPLVLNAVTKVAAEYLPGPRKPAGIAVGSAGIFAGMLVALVLGSALGGHEIRVLLVVQAAVAVLAAVALCATLLRRGSGSAVDERVAVGVGALREVAAVPGVRVLGALLFLGFGAFVALTTWLQALLHHYRISDNTAGALLAGMVAAGAVCSALLPPALVRRRLERRLVAASIVAVIAGGIMLALFHSVLVDALMLVPMGMLLLTDLPVLLELSERDAGAAAGTVASLLWLSGQLGGLVVALLVQALVHHPAGAFLLLAGVGVLALPLLTRLGSLLDASRARDGESLEAPSYGAL